MEGPAFLYLDQIQTRVLEEQDPGLCELLFASSDYFVRAPKKAHPVVRASLKAVYEGEAPEYFYLHAPAELVRERLAIQGYTAGAMERAWAQARDAHIQHLAEMSEQFDSNHLRTELAVVGSITYSEWQQALEERAIASFEGGPVAHEGIDMEGILRGETLWDPLAVLALRMDALKPSRVWADLTSLYFDYGYDRQLTFHENLENERAPYQQALGKIVVLTEGISDQRVTAAAMGALYPEYAGAYQFMDFEAFRIEGGASPLARMVKAFAGVRIQTRMLAVFDNDAAGAEALNSLRGIALPRNLRTMSLPDIELARRYPTVGPEGVRLMDVNGRACAIELFFGRRCLTGDDGNLRPVRWSQWNRVVDRYQGELVDKANAQDAFLASLMGAPRTLRRRFPEMDQLLTAIFAAFKD